MPTYSTYMPIRAGVELTYLRADKDVQVTADAWCEDRYWVDERDLPQQRDPSAPPVALSSYWQASTGNVLPVPELRGAIMAPRRRVMPTEDHLTPCGPLTMVAEDWYDSDLAPDASWSLQWQQELGVKAALFAPGTLANGMVRTLEAECVDRSFFWLYRTMTPEPAGTGEYWPAQSHGVRIHMGCQSAIPQITLEMTAPHPGDDGGGLWRLYEWDAERATTTVDWQRQEFRGSMESTTRPETHWVMVIPTCGRLVIMGSKLESAWVYAPQDGITLRSGQAALEFRQCRGWAVYGRVAYPASVAMQSPVITYGDSWTQAAEIRVNAETGNHDDTDDASYVGAYEVIDSGTGYFTARHSVTITNASADTEAPTGVTVGKTHTPIMYALQEIHEATLTDPEETPEDKSEYLDDITVRHSPTGRGHVATAVLRNWDSPGDGETEYVLGNAFGTAGVDLYGIGRWSLRTRHITSQGPEDFATAFNGYTTRIRALPRTDKAQYPMLSVSMQDRTFLWGDGKSSMAFMPDFAGWDFQEACLLILEAFGCPEEETVWPEEYADDPVSVPRQPLSGATKFAPDVEVMEALDQLCKWCGFRWHLDTTGRAVFEYSPAIKGASVLTLEPEATNTRDKLYLPVTTELDYASARTMSYVRGTNAWGGAIEALYSGGKPALTTPGTIDYIGRRLWAASIEPHNMNPYITAQLQLLHAQKASTRIEWRTIGRDLWFGDVVTVNIPNTLVPEGTEMVVTARTDYAKRGQQVGDDLRWWQVYECAIVGAVDV